MSIEAVLAGVKAREREAAGVIGAPRTGKLSSKELLDGFEDRHGGNMYSVSSGTKLVYRDMWKSLQRWWLGSGYRGEGLKEEEADYLWPVDSLVAVKYLRWMDEEKGYSRNTVRVRMSALGTLHEMGGHANPVRAESVYGYQRQMRRERRGEGLRKAYAIKSAELMEMVALHEKGEDMFGTRARDCSALMLAWAGGLRISEAMDLKWKDVSVDVEGGYTKIRLRSSKTDKYGKGADVYAYDAMLTGGGYDDRIVLSSRMFALRKAQVRARDSGVTKLERGHLGMDEGRVFAGLHRPRVHRLIVDLFERCGFRLEPGEHVSPHSLRAGCASQAADQGHSYATIKEHLRHADIKTTAGYCRRMSSRTAAMRLAGLASK